jgi:hypothetical protein
MLWHTTCAINESSFSISGDLINYTIEQVRLCVVQALELDTLSEAKPEVYIENDVFHLWIYIFIAGFVSERHCFLVNSSYRGSNQAVSDFVNRLAIAFHQHGIAYNFEFSAEDRSDAVQIIKHSDFCRVRIIATRK